jgi:SAM-dependent methyltransferase
MPSSHHRQISPILDLVSHLRPTSVLDVGIGLGAYGFLVSQALDADRLLPEGEHSSRLWLAGIEGFEGYIGDLQRSIYDEIHIGDLLDLLPSFQTEAFDLVLVVDVLEHVAPERVPEVLEHVTRIGATVVVSTPLLWAEQGPILSNEFERHRSHPRRADFKKVGFRTFIPDSASLIAVYAKDQDWLEYYRRRLLFARLRSPLPAWAMGPLGTVRGLVRGRPRAPTRQ